MALYVCLKNPYIWEQGRRAAICQEESIALTKEFIEAGYDGVIVPNQHADPQYASHYEIIAFSHTQIKSAYGNSGLFDPDSDSLDDHIQSAPKPRERQSMHG